MAYIVPSNQILGEGTEKTAYACKISESKEGAKVAFDSKYIRDIKGGVNSICIVEVKNNKDKIIDKYLNESASRFGLDYNYLVASFRSWNRDSGPFTHENASVRRAIMWAMNYVTYADYKFENEMRLHNDFGLMAPPIYEIIINGETVSVNEITNKLHANQENSIFVLLKKCEKRKTSNDEEKRIFLLALRDLVDTFIENNLINMDIKDDNVCSDGRGLDFDTEYMLIIGDKDKENLKKHGKTYMLTQFLANIGLFNKEFFPIETLDRADINITRESIAEMIEYFRIHPEMKSFHCDPMTQLFYYCTENFVGTTTQSFTDHICSHIFQTKRGGMRNKTRRVRNKRNNTKRIKN